MYDHWESPKFPGFPGCERLQFAVPARTFRRPFFSPAREPQDPRLGIAEDAPDCGLRTEAGKPKGIIEPAWFSHPRIMPDFSPRGEGEDPRNQGVSWPSTAILCFYSKRKLLTIEFLRK